MTRRLSLAVTMAALLCGLGCGSATTTPTAPSGPVPGPRTGTWTGTLTDAANGRSTVRIDLQETLVGNVGLLSGAWTATLGAGGSASGDVTGTITGASVSLTLRRATPLSCPASTGLPLLNGAFIATTLALADAALTGPYAYQTCDLALPGTLELRRP